MGRNKDPEQTYENIVSTAAKLFVEKGYEQTSIQDILNVLQLSKGGLYHHFRSKEDILEAVMQKRNLSVSAFLNQIILNTTAETTKEKLKKILYTLSADEEIHALDMILPSQTDNPCFVVKGLETCIKQDAPVICRLFEEGISDGSLEITEPELCAEIFLMLLNIWSNPALFGRDDAGTKKRLIYLQSLMRLLGADIIEDALIDSLMNDYLKMGAFRH